MNFEEWEKTHKHLPTKADIDRVIESINEAEQYNDKDDIFSFLGNTIEQLLEIKDKLPMEEIKWVKTIIGF